LERNGELHRTSVEIDPALELTEISVRALREDKPALYIERPTGSAYPAVVNHFSSSRRIELALGKHPDQLGGELITFLEQAFSPTIAHLFEHRSTVKRMLNARPRTVRRARSQEIAAAPDLDLLPIQKCWPFDGGRFVTYGQVVTYDPVTLHRNIGIYRMQVFDRSTTGMHWQIQKGGGFHYHQSERRDKDLEIAVALGTDPALLLATVAALPEGVDEAMFAGFLGNRRMEFAKGLSVSVPVPADAEFVLEGVVPANERHLEGPFGDHFGHYSAAAEFPLLRIKLVTHRENPVYPAIVVGRPPMEDKFLGDATQQILGPLVRLIHREVTSVWAYYEAGFHNLLVVAIEQRYQKESMKAALGLMGTDQLSLTKCMILVSDGVNPRDWSAVLREVRENFDPHYDFVMIPKVPLDTLDFTSYKMNLGSKMIIDATRKRRAGSVVQETGRPDTGQTSSGVTCENFAGFRSSLISGDRRILDVELVEETLLLVKIDLPIDSRFLPQAPEQSFSMSLLDALISRPELSRLKMIVIVSPDVDIHDRESYIWGVFTRFDCERDIIFARQKLVGISPVFGGVMGIDATWKPGYPDPLVMTDDIVRRVDDKWDKIWK
jgi:4-hydroxy-3-polyprenylbenzoate decarboxylase